MVYFKSIFLWIQETPTPLIFFLCNNDIQQYNGEKQQKQISFNRGAKDLSNGEAWSSGLSAWLDLLDSQAVRFETREDFQTWCFFKQGIKSHWLLPIDFRDEHKGELNKPNVLVANRQTMLGINHSTWFPTALFLNIDPNDKSLKWQTRYKPRSNI